jgi:hypothetical protein
MRGKECKRLNQGSQGLSNNETIIHCAEVRMERAQNKKESKRGRRQDVEGEEADPFL